MSDDWIELIGDDLPYHLRLDAPPLGRCNRCQRQTWSEAELGTEDRVPQPDGNPCGGRIVASAAARAVSHNPALSEGREMSAENVVSGTATPEPAESRSCADSDGSNRAVSTPGWLRFEGMCWPDPTDPRELDWRLRYRPDSITRGDQLALASVVSAYAYLIGLDSRTRQQRVMQIRAALKAAAADTRPPSYHPAPVDSSTGVLGPKAGGF